MSAQKPVPYPEKRSPLGRALFVLPLMLIATGAAAAWAVLRVPDEWQQILAWSAGSVAGLLSIVVTVAAYGLQAAGNARHRLRMMRTDAELLVDEAFPDLVTRLREGVSLETVLAEGPAVTHEVHQRMLRQFGEEIGSGERMRAAAMSTCANAASRVQALTTTMLADLREMEDRYSEEVLGDLLKLDHTTAQAGRLADSIAVLTGARSGRRWTKPIVMESILRGAVGRIHSYQRVRVHSSSSLAIAGHAAEGVMHALAELMDNATTFSPPSEQVHVYVEEVQAGVVVAIEDGGLVMGELALRRAEQAVSSSPLDLTALSGTRLGLAVVGCLARKHGLTVFFRPSSRGGTGVVVMIPRHLITESKQESSSVAAQAPRSATPVEASRQAVPGAGPPSEAPAPSTGDGPPGLPQRRRGETLASAASTASTKPVPTQAPTDTGAKFGAFRRAARGDGPITHNDGSITHNNDGGGGSA